MDMYKHPEPGSITFYRKTASAPIIDLSFEAGWVCQSKTCQWLMKAAIYCIDYIVETTVLFPPFGIFFLLVETFRIS